MNTTRQILVRFISLAAVVAGGMLLISLDDSSGDANIGAGLAVLAAAGLAALVWGVFDGRREGFGPSALRWGLVAVIAGLAMAAYVMVQDGDYTPGAFGSAAFLWAYLGAHLGISALIGAALGQLGRRRPGP